MDITTKRCVDPNMLTLVQIGPNTFVDKTSFIRESGRPFWVYIYEEYGRYFLHSPPQNQCGKFPDEIGIVTLWVSQTLITDDQKIISQLPEGRFVSDGYNIVGCPLYWVVQVEMLDILVEMNGAKKIEGKDNCLMAHIYVETNSYGVTRSFMRKLLEGAYDIDYERKITNLKRQG